MNLLFWLELFGARLTTQSSFVGRWKVKMVARSRREGFVCTDANATDSVRKLSEWDDRPVVEGLMKDGASGRTKRHTWFTD